VSESHVARSSKQRERRRKLRRGRRNGHVRRGGETALSPERETGCGAGAEEGGTWGNHGLPHEARRSRCAYPQAAPPLVVVPAPEPEPDETACLTKAPLLLTTYHTFSKPWPFVWPTFESPTYV
jgi:hypothetical protein